MMLTSDPRRPSWGPDLARKLGARYFRPESLFLEGWDGSCPACDAALSAGLELVLTVRNTGPEATSPPADMEKYKARLGEVLARFRPALLAVENEENSGLFYAGSPEQYLAELEAACGVAHDKGVPCTNGGLVSDLVALLVYDHYRSRGENAAAEDFARRAFRQEVRTYIDSPTAREQLRRGKILLAGYRRAGADYLNFHWYLADARALEEAVGYLEAAAGLPAITGEVGQFTGDPAQTKAVMAKLAELGVRVAVWFAQDGPKARGLVGRDGSIRPTGEAFREFIGEHFP